MLHNRKRELDYLDTRFASRRAEFVVLYGRRRVGKTSLLYHWSQGKKPGTSSIFFFATNDDSQTLLKRFSQLIRQVEHGQNGVTLDAAFVYKDWETAFKALVPLAQSQRLIVVIDEYPRLVKAFPPISSYIQMLWDLELQHTQLFFVLTGSLLSVMKQEILDSNAPLYLRHTWPFQLQPLITSDLPDFFPNYSPTALIETYSVLGGMPYYLISVDPTVDLLTNIRNAILKPAGPLFNEIPLQLHLELQGRDVMLAMRVLQAIANGSHTRAEIRQRSALKESTLTDYLQTLEELGLITVHQPLDRVPDQQRWGRYHLADPFMRFWYRYVNPRQAELEIGYGEDSVWQDIRLQMAHIVAPIWEQIARMHLLQNGRQHELPPINEVGSWWNRRAQLDVVGVDRHTRSVVFGEVRWRQEPFTRSHLEKLMSQSQQWLHGSDTHWDVHYAVYARTIGSELVELAEQERTIHLFTPDAVTNKASNA
ncbi:MAG: ATP-binding protein [Chloroflexota bacterium]